MGRIKGIVCVVAVVAAFLASCDGGESFTVKGDVSGAKGRMLYFSNIGIRGVEVVDSVRLGGNGDFEFSCPRPECYDFYRLKLENGGRGITIAIDSTETVTVHADAANFADSCTIEGSPESLKVMALISLERALQEQVNRLLQSKSPTVGITRETIYRLIYEFKQNICREYIAAAPRSAAAYYSLFLRMNGEPLFDPLHNRFDSRCFSAVATGLNLINPHSQRAMHLYNMARKGMQATRPVVRDTVYVEPTDAAIGLFDIKLPDIYGDSISLTSLKGKVVLLDFTVYSDARISARNLELRELYSDYKERGLEIYQISLDEDVHFWKTSADNLPWICVRDGNGFHSYNATLYRVDKLPTYFLINRDNEVVLRDEQVSNLRETIEGLLAGK